VEEEVCRAVEALRPQSRSRARSVFRGDPAHAVAEVVEVVAEVAVAVAEVVAVAVVSVPAFESSRLLSSLSMTK